MFHHGFDSNSVVFQMVVLLKSLHWCTLHHRHLWHLSMIKVTVYVDNHVDCEPQEMPGSYIAFVGDSTGCLKPLMYFYQQT
ncbi:unnamed protein product [Cyberlindnera jadinii]|uniref:Uncharacterized protein n=1 Tax=Cyberlindnera jadinii (strain ATCC 18201 / CBS 1600 / BCRC 20928 / JCM 3617 / NBRC 0987 / NRRL Y-1542) TaxID=983966 RepID=A0A0H5C0E3_CYBJN|nr:unnamed protein product [Cyberlindnera jadinii]